MAAPELEAALKMSNAMMLAEDVRHDADRTADTALVDAGIRMSTTHRTPMASHARPSPPLTPCKMHVASSMSTTSRMAMSQAAMIRPAMNMMAVTTTTTPTGGRTSLYKFIIYEQFIYAS